MNTNLKVAISAIGLVALVSSPVLAKTRAQTHHASAPVVSQNTVVAPTGQVVGTDPGPAIRFEMRRDWTPAVGYD